MGSDFSLALQNNKPIRTIASIPSTSFHNVEYPSETKRISIGCEATDLYVSFSYSDGDGFSITDTTFIPKKNMFSMTVPNGLHNVQIAAKSGTASNVVFVMEEFT